MSLLLQNLLRMIEDNERLRAAGVNREDPTTWRPDLVRPLLKESDNGTTPHLC